MTSTTLGVKVDPHLRGRLKAAATQIDRTPHWLIKQAIFSYLERIEVGERPTESKGQAVGAYLDVREGEANPAIAHPFLEFAQSVQQSVLRAAITAAYRRPEAECVPFVIGLARLPADIATDVQAMASKLVEALRSKFSGEVSRA